MHNSSGQGMAVNFLHLRYPFHFVLESIYKCKVCIVDNGIIVLKMLHKLIKTKI